MAPEVNKGHIRSPLYSKISSFLYDFVLNLILSKSYIDINIIKTELFYEMKFDFKGHDSYRRSNEAISYLKMYFFLDIFSV